MNITEKMLEDLKPVHGFKRVINNISDTLVDDTVKRFKSRFGIEMYLTSPSEIRIVTKWIKKYDKKFKYHITNPHVMKSIKEDDCALTGVFIIKIAKATYMLVDARQDSLNINNPDRQHQTSFLYMYIFGKRAFHVFRSVSKFIDARSTSANRMYSIVGGKREGSSNFWECTASKLTPRTMDTIFMDADQKHRILNHIDNWMKSEDIYSERGLLFKTGILLYGTPGTGKSSLAMAIANYVGCGLITIDPTTFQYMNISEITESIVADECKYVVLIDEIDTLFKSRTDTTITDEQKEKAAKLLAFLDSQQSPTNVIFIATTNYIHVLDQALMRKGRFDLVEEMNDITLDIAREMCKSFDLTNKECDDLLSDYEYERINPAVLQDMILEVVKKKTQLNSQEEGDDEALSEIKGTDVDVKVVYAGKHNTVEEYNESLMERTKKNN